MTRSDLLPIYIKSYRLIQHIFTDTVKFPQAYKFTLGTPLNENALRLCTLITQANRSENRVLVLNDFLTLVETIRLQLRLSVDFHIISYKRYAFLAEQLENILAQGLAWQKSERRKT